MKRQIIFYLLVYTLAFIFSCKKEHSNNESKEPPRTVNDRTGQPGHLTQANTYSGEVVTKWMHMQLELMKTATGIPNVAFARSYAYSGIAVYESVVPGMPAYQSLAGQLTALASLTPTTPGYAYHWAASANAALASINRAMFPNATAAVKASVDSLELSLNAQYQTEVNSETFDRSVSRGKDIAKQILNWASSDNADHASDKYIPPTGPGLWVATAPAFANASTPYWGNLRLLVPGSVINTQLPAPVPYNEDPSSDFYKMAKHVYDVSQTLDSDQMNMAFYWRDVPGVTTPGHYVSILKQVLEKDQIKLDKAALSYALGGIAVYDAAVICWQAKYQYNLVRPITYIRTVLGHPLWNSFLGTPAHPEYPSAHAVLSETTADVLTYLFGDNYAFTDHTYDYLSMHPRSFSSFKAFAEDAGNSRLYAGIHYQPSIDAGLVQGKTVAQNVIKQLKFLKE